MTTEDNAPETVEPVDPNLQPNLFPSNFMAHQNTMIQGVPPQLYEHLNPPQMDVFLGNLDKSDERWASVGKHKSTMSLIGVIAVLVAVVALLLFGRPDVIPVVKELLSHAAALFAGVIGGIGLQKSQQNSN